MRPEAETRVGVRTELMDGSDQIWQVTVEQEEKSIDPINRLTHMAHGWRYEEYITHN
jgi:hypothetical protein